MNLILEEKVCVDMHVTNEWEGTKRRIGRLGLMCWIDGCCFNLIALTLTIPHPSLTLTMEKLLLPVHEIEITI